MIENTQRDLNIALMNELAIIFDRLGIRTKDVLDAAATKWNFLRYTPGLVGGHCIGVDPYYLTAKAESVGHPEVILAGRRIDGMGAYRPQAGEAAGPERRAGSGPGSACWASLKETMRRSAQQPRARHPARAEGVRHRGDGARPPGRCPGGACRVRDCARPLELFHALDAVVLAVPHASYREAFAEGRLSDLLTRTGILIDVKSVLSPAALPAAGQPYWSLEAMRLAHSGPVLVTGAAGSSATMWRSACWAKAAAWSASTT